MGCPHVPCLNWNKSITGLKKIRTGVTASLLVLCTPLWYWHNGCMLGCPRNQTKEAMSILGQLWHWWCFLYMCSLCFALMADISYNCSGWLGVKHQVTYLLPLAVTDPNNLKQNLWLQVCILLIFYLLEGVWLLWTKHVWDFCWFFALFLKMFLFWFYIFYIYEVHCILEIEHHQYNYVYFRLVDSCCLRATETSYFKLQFVRDRLQASFFKHSFIGI